MWLEWPFFKITILKALLSLFYFTKFNYRNIIYPGEIPAFRSFLGSALLLVVMPRRSKCWMILLAKMPPFYIKSKDPQMCTVHTHLYSILSWKKWCSSFPKFCQDFRKKFSRDATKTIAQCEISLINLEPGFPKCIAQNVILNLIVIQIQGE